MMRSGRDYFVKVKLSAEDAAACERDLMLYGNYYVTVGNFAEGERGRRIAPQNISERKVKQSVKK